MFTLSNYQQQAQDVLVPIYGDRETSAVIKLWFGSRLDMSPIDLIMRREEEVVFPLFTADLAQLRERLQCNWCSVKHFSLIDYISLMSIR